MEDKDRHRSLSHLLYPRRICLQVGRVQLVVVGTVEELLEVVGIVVARLVVLELVVMEQLVEVQLEEAVVRLVLGHRLEVAEERQVGRVQQAVVLAAGRHHLAPGLVGRLAVGRLAVAVGRLVGPKTIFMFTTSYAHCHHSFLQSKSVERAPKAWRQCLGISCRLWPGGT